MKTKLTFVAYPLVALLSLLAAVAAHAQSANDPIDHAGYGPTLAGSTSAVSRDFVRAEARAARDASLFDVKDKSGYGRTVVNTASVHTRAEVRAEAIAAREAGYDLLYREGGDLPYAALQRAKAADTAHVLAAAPLAIAK